MPNHSIPHDMDKHTFIGKRKIGSTEICDFTDYQGIGHDPLYKRYDSVHSIVRKAVDPRFAHFFAAPDYSAKDDAVNWYIEEWTEMPETLGSLEGERREKYLKIKDRTISHYKKVLKSLSGEELQVLACAMRYIDDDFIFCCDDKVHLVAWGMTPDTRKHISKGELVHEAPTITKYHLTFDAGENGKIASRLNSHISLAEGTEITKNDLPEVNPEEGLVFTGWTPEPVGMKVTGDMTFTAKYDKAAVPPPQPPVPPLPADALISFNAGPNGILKGNPEVTKPLGSRLIPNEIPIVTPNKGYVFKGWDINPLQTLVSGDMTINAVYDKKKPWYAGWLKWVLLGLLLLLLLLLFAWLFRNCHGGCARGVNGVVDADRIVNAAGDSIDDNGIVRPIELDDGRLPEDQAIVAPVLGEGGELPPIERNPGVPPVIANRLFLFLEDESDSVDALAADFKKAYPGDQYSIIGFDRDVKSLLIQIPESERDQIRKTINSRIPNHKFLVFDEGIYELNGHVSSSTSSSPGWHINAVKAREGWRITKGSPEVRVAVVDDGIDPSHPMFKGRIVDAYNVFTQNNHLSRGAGHGTHTAGLAVGSLDFLNQGAAGIAPDCRLMPVQVLDNGMCPLSALVSGIMYSVHKNADVVNISIGPTFQGLNALPVEMQNEIARSQFKNVEKLFQRVCRIASAKNTILVFAAGNDDILSSIPPENRTNVAITVGAVDQKLYPTEFTNYGPCTDISAPGKEIYSAFPVRNFRSFDGTSMAAPIVSGTIALMKSLKKDLTVRQARNVLYKTGCDVYGYMPPMVQVNLALEAVRKGDFSDPAPRQTRPVPGTAIGAIEGDAPASWADPVAGVIITDPSVGIPVDEAVPGVTSGPGVTYPATGHPGVGNPDPAPGNESDYEEIRRMIAIYKKKISELEGQLPENKKK